MSSFGAFKIKGGTVTRGKESAAIKDITVRVETSGDVERRITASRMVLMGPLALAFRKKKDHRTLYFSVEGPGVGWLAEVDPKDETKVRKFALELKSLGAS